MKKSKLILRASAAGQWSKCTGLLSYPHPKNPFQDKKYADFGTLTHKVLEFLSLQYKEENQLKEEIKKVIKKGFNSFERQEVLKNIDLITEYISFFLDKINIDVDDWKKVGVIKEERFIHEEKDFIISGQPDLIIYQFINGILYLTIYDLKTGQKEVLAENNKQLSAYAHLVIEKVFKGINFKKIEITGVIIQPSLMSISNSEIIYDENYLSDLYVEPKKRSFETGSHCLYCEYKFICKEFKKVIKQFLSPEFQNFEQDKISAYYNLLQYADAVVKGIDYAKRDLISGLETGLIDAPGFSLIQANGRRKWSNEKPSIIARQLGLKIQNITENILRSPKDLENDFKASGQKKKLDKMQKLVFQPTYSKLKIEEIKTSKKEVKGRKQKKKTTD